MTSKLLLRGAHEAQDELDLALSQAHTALHPHLLTPPFQIPASAPHRTQLTHALLYALLTQPGAQPGNATSATLLDHLTTVTTDGYSSVTSLLLRLVTDSYPKLLDHPRLHLISTLKHLITLNAVDSDTLCCMLLRQIVGGDITPGNIWLGTQILELLNANVPWLTANHSLLTAAVYTYLRLLADHSTPKSAALNELRQAEIRFCCAMLREHFQDCMAIGRDLVRLLQDVAFVPEFESLWRDLLSSPGVFKSPSFTDVTQLYAARTPTRYFQSRLTPEMEGQVKFMLTHIRMGNQRRYQTWFTQRYLTTPESESLVCDIIRYVCCVHHPSNQILQSDILPRWALIGWLLKCCKSNHVEANAKLALLYDWLFFSPKTDNIMNIEPGLLVMVHSIPKYADMTNALLEFLFLLMEHYDPPRKEVVQRGVAASFDILVGKGVVRSLEPLCAAPVVAAALREKLTQYFPMHCKPDAAEGLKPKKPTAAVRDEPPEADRGDHRGQSPEDKGEVSQESSETAGRKRRRSGGPPPQDEMLTQLEKFSKALGSSQDAAVKVLESSLGCLSSHERAEKFAAQVNEVITKLGNYQLFTVLTGPPGSKPEGDETMSITSTLFRLYVGSCFPHMRSMLMYWHREGLPVGPRLLCYVSRLAEELEMKDHVAGILSSKESEAAEVCSDDGETEGGKRLKRLGSTVRQKSLQQACVTAVGEAFKAYEEFLKATVAQNEDQLRGALLADLSTCLLWSVPRLQRLLPAVYRYLPGLAAGCEEVMQLAVAVVSPAGVVSLEVKLAVGEFSVLGSRESAGRLIRASLSWDSFEQIIFWRLLNAEVHSCSAVSMVDVVKVCGSINMSMEADAEAVSGLLSLLRSSPPSSALASALLGWPAALGRVTVAVFSCWLSVFFSELSSALKEVSEEDAKVEVWPALDCLLGHLDEVDVGSRSMAEVRTKQAGEIRQMLLRLAAGHQESSETCVT